MLIHPVLRKIYGHVYPNTRPNHWFEMIVVNPGEWSRGLFWLYDGVDARLQKSGILHLMVTPPGICMEQKYWSQRIGHNWFQPRRRGWVRTTPGDPEFRYLRPVSQ